MSRHMNRCQPLSINRKVGDLWKGGLAVLSSAAIASGLALATPSAATAQAAYGSYLGVGAGFGVTHGSVDSESSRTGGLIAVRYKFLQAPISIRTQALLGNGNAIVPTISYDLPLSWRADAYLGLGAAIPLDGNRATPVGNQTSFALQPGIDYALPNSNFVVFGNAIIGINGWRSGNTAVSIQTGLGVRF